MSVVHSVIIIYFFFKRAEEEEGQHLAVVSTISSESGDSSELVPSTPIRQVVGPSDRQKRCLRRGLLQGEPVTKVSLFSKDEASTQ